MGDIFQSCETLVTGWLQGTDICCKGGICPDFKSCNRLSILYYQTFGKSLYYKARQKNIRASA